MVFVMVAPAFREARHAHGTAPAARTSVLGYIDLLVDLMPVRRQPPWHSNSGERPGPELSLPPITVAGRPEQSRTEPENAAASRPKP